MSTLHVVSKIRYESEISQLAGISEAAQRAARVELPKYGDP